MAPTCFLIQTETSLTYLWYFFRLFNCNEPSSFCIKTQNISPMFTASVTSEAQGDSRWPLIAVFRVRSRFSPCGIKEALRQVSSEYFGLPLSVLCLQSCLLMKLKSADWKEERANSGNLRKNAEMVPKNAELIRKTSSCYCMLLM
jgi:hypothetical protein